jgi:hypothetical protein
MSLFLSFVFDAGIAPEHQGIVKAVAQMTAEMLWTYVQYNEARVDSFMQTLRANEQQPRRTTPSSHNSSFPSSAFRQPHQYSTPEASSSSTPTTTYAADGDSETRASSVRRELLPNGASTILQFLRKIIG